MTEIAQSIDLKLAEKLKDPAYRRKFFLAETSALIAEQLIKLRKRRGLNQQEVADKIGTKQPAICRVEQATYRSWSFKTLLSIADAMNARLRIIIEPYEDILSEYQDKITSNKIEPSRDTTILKSKSIIRNTLTGISGQIGEASNYKEFELSYGKHAN